MCASVPSGHRTNHLPGKMKTFHCDKCSQQVFFENTLCFNCDSMLGYQPDQRVVSSFEAAGEGTWRSLNKNDAGRLYKQCSNYATQHVCNWMLDADDPNELCASCQLTVVIPTLSSEKNHLFWQRLESAKRRLLYSLYSLHLTPVSKEVDEETGLAFQFLEDGPGDDERVMTGHDNGLITLNIAEADPAQRERTREQMHEHYRTLLGHFRHESGHYYFDRLIADSEWLDGYRELFGDERQDYGESLKQHYEHGAPADWEQHYISTYASSHPWEDWAETWAHYLHMIDTLETAHACGLSLKPRKKEEPEMVITAPPLKIDSFDEIIADWFALTYVLNSLNRSVGTPDSYPFKLPTPVQEKLHFIHKVVLAHVDKNKPQAKAPRPAAAGAQAKAPAPAV
jgi:hypothetical protein